MKFEIDDRAIPLPYAFKEDVQKTADIASQALGLTDADVTVKVSFVSRPDGEVSAFGEFADVPNTYGINLNPIAGAQWPDLLERLCHELVHVAQVAHGELKFNGDDAIWHGVEVKGFSADDTTTPWEKDADQRGRPIFAELKRQATN